MILFSFLNIWNASHVTIKQFKSFDCQLLKVSLFSFNNETGKNIIFWLPCPWRTNSFSKVKLLTCWKYPVRVSESHQRLCVHSSLLGTLEFPEFFHWDRSSLCSTQVWRPVPESPSGRRSSHWTCPPASHPAEKQLYATASVLPAVLISPWKKKTDTLLRKYLLCIFLH